MNISRVLAIKILKYLNDNPRFYFPFVVVCKEYSPEDGDFVEIEPREWELIAGDENYATFQLWENLQNLYEDTINLMAKGFIEKITNESLENRIEKLAQHYRQIWQNGLLESGGKNLVLNEFENGKASALDDCLYLIKEHQK